MFLDVPTGISFGSVFLTLLEFTTVILFFIGGLFYYKLTKIIGNKNSQVLALCGTIINFIGGIPNAIDKMCWTFFSYDTVFNSTWLFFFVGIGYILLFLSALLMNKKKDNATKLNSFIILTLPGFHKPMKYMSMLLASVGMFGFYIIMFMKSYKIIGKKAFFYLITLACTVFLIIFSAVGKFSTILPNIIAQSVNSLGYLALIFANVYYIKKEREY